MRHDYPTTIETIKVLNGCADQVAEEADVSPSYVYSILEQRKTDFFAVFRHYFAAAVRAGCDVSHWLTELERIQMKYTFTEPQCHKSETADLTKETADIAGAVLKGEPLYVQLREATEVRDKADRVVKAVLTLINAEKDAEGRPNTRMNGNRNRIFAKDAVAKRRAS